MNATKILWGQVLVVSFVAVAFLGGATEWVAWHLAFQSQLGRPWFEVLGWPLYQPQTFFWWWFAYDAYARDIFVEGAYIAASGGIAAVIVAIAISVWRAREINRVTHLWLRALGRDARNLRSRPARPRRRAARPTARPLPAPRWSRACPVLRANPIRQRRRSCRSDAPRMVRLGDRPRHQRRKLDVDVAPCCPGRTLPKRAADDHLTEEQGGLLAHIFRRELRQCPEFREAPDRGGGYPSMSNLRGR